MALQPHAKSVADHGKCRRRCLWSLKKREKKPLCEQQSHCRSGIRTRDLQVMGLTTCRLSILRLMLLILSRLRILRQKKKGSRSLMTLRRVTLRRNSSKSTISTMLKAQRSRITSGPRASATSWIRTSWPVQSIGRMPVAISWPLFGTISRRPKSTVPAKQVKKPKPQRQAEPDPQELPLSFEERISRLATLKAEVKDV